MTDIANFKIHDLGTKVNPIPINYCTMGVDAYLPDAFEWAVKILSSIEGKLDGTIELTRIILPNSLVKPFTFTLRPEALIERHSQPFIAVIAKHNWVAIDVSGLKEEICKAAPNLDELCQQGQHHTQDTDACVNCGLQATVFASSEVREIHQKDRSSTVEPEMLPARISEDQPPFDFKVDNMSSQNNKQEALDLYKIGKAMADFLIAIADNEVFSTEFRNDAKRLYQPFYEYSGPQKVGVFTAQVDVPLEYYNAAQSFLDSIDNKRFPNSWTKLKVLLAEFIHDQSTSPGILGQAAEFKKIADYVAQTSLGSCGDLVSEFVIQTLKDYEKQAQLEFGKLNIEEFAKINLDRCDAPKPQGFGGHKNWMPDSWTNAVCGEAGEAANKAKKFSKAVEDFATVGMYERFCKTPEGQEMLKDITVELADTIIYALIAIQKFGFNPTEILTTTFNDVSLRENMPFAIEATD
jgi:hypothetical protein